MTCLVRRLFPFKEIDFLKLCTISISNSHGISSSNSNLNSNSNCKEKLSETTTRTTTTTEDYFKLFKIKRSFDIDPSELKRNFTQLQRVLHPDKFVTKSLEEQETSADKSSQVNQAFNTLKNPHSRGLYLLSLSGVEVKEDESDQELRKGMFLEEVMEINEKVEEAKTNSQMERLRQEINDKLSELTLAISKAFKRTDGLEDCKQLLIRLKFYQTVSHSLKEKEVVK